MSRPLTRRSMFSLPAVLPLVVAAAPAVATVVGVVAGDLDGRIAMCRYGVLTVKQMRRLELASFPPIPRKFFVGEIHTTSDVDPAMVGHSDLTKVEA